MIKELKEVIKADVSDRELADKYILKVDGKEVGFGYLFNRETNPIEIFVLKEFQSNGYGKFWFGELLRVLKQGERLGVLFEVKDSDYRFRNIIMQAGAFEIGRNLPTIKYALKLK